MIVGVGIDLVSVDRAAQLLARHGERFLTRCFTPGEVARAGDTQHIAGLVAAKEAAFKALGSGWGDGVGWRQVVVGRDASGRPLLDLRGVADERAQLMGVARTHVSITHAGGVAVAVVILETA